MPNDEIVNKIEELRKICDPNETEATLVHELKQINEQIANIQSELSELKNIPDTLYYDEIQESRDITRKAELQKQDRELEKQVSIHEMELKDLKSKEAELNKALKELQQTKNQNVSTASKVSEYEATLTTLEAKDNMKTILTEVDKKVEDDNKAFHELAVQYKEVQVAIEEKASLIDSIKENRNNLQNQMSQLSNDIKDGNKYINQEKKNKDLAKIAELEKKLQSLTERQADIVSNPIMLLSLANKAALDSDLVTTLNKIKGVKESLLQKPYMDIPNDSIDEQMNIAIEKRETFYNQINGKDYDSNGLPAADERIDDINASIAKWVEEINTLKARKEEIDNGTKYRSADKINKITEEIKRLSEEVADFETKENITSEEEVAIDKRKEEIKALKQILNRYFADQNANIEEAKCIEGNIELLNARTAASKAEIKDLRKMSKSLDGIDILSRKKDRDELKKYVDAVMDIKKLPQYHRMLVIIDEILATLGKDIVVPTIEEQEEALVTDKVETEVQAIEQQAEETKEPINEIHPIEDVKADEITPPLVEEQEEIAIDSTQDTNSKVEENKTSGVVFEQAFKEEPVKEEMTSLSDEELVAEIDKTLNGTASKVVNKEEIKPQTIENINPFANISDLQTVESDTQKASAISTPAIDPSTPSTLKVENQEGVVVKFPAKENIQSASFETPVKETDQISSIASQELSANPIDDFFAAQWEQVTNDDVQALGKVA